jgi:hypothetical protein
VPDREVDVLLTSQSAAESDRVRAFAADLGADLLDARDLHGLLAYGLGRETGEAIARRHFGRPLSIPEEWPAIGRSERLADEAASDRARWPRWQGCLENLGGRRRALGGAAVLAIVLAAAVLGASLPSGSSGVTFSGGPTEDVVGDTVGQGERAESEVSVTPAPAASTGPELDATNETLGRLPPGLGESGITDAEALARAHEAAIANRSYRWVVTYEERIEDRTVSRAREVVTVEAPDVYTVALQREGEGPIAATLFSDGEAYADGEHRYEPVRVAGGREDVRKGALGFEDDTFADRAETYVEWYLSVTRSAIVGVHEHNTRTFYRIETVGDPYPGAENARASAIVGSEGMVYRLRTEREIPDSDRTVVLTFRYTDVGNATVSPPAWYAANASNGTPRTTEAATDPANVGTVEEDAESD